MKYCSILNVKTLISKNVATECLIPKSGIFFLDHIAHSVYVCDISTFRIFGTELGKHPVCSSFCSPESCGMLSFVMNKRFYEHF